MYDLSRVKKLKPEIVEAYRKALIAALDEDYQALDEYLIDLGARVDNQPAVDEAYYAMWRDILIIPFLNDEPYDFAEADIHKHVAAKTSTVFRIWITRRQWKVSLLTVIAGHYWMLKDSAYRPHSEVN